ncbi:hypothetical protein ARMSODRAFT_983309 [Armillaria solidipes]|uniref:Uncharacterized protein n=1 Tax=Armillaria solidipes TaxID=1076256 RepID=A0A2H3AJK4_9AGAR|nr:hypothetical protein ARMSODRAFT_983309 [Armillaria solidipes]
MSIGRHNLWNRMPETFFSSLSPIATNLRHRGPGVEEISDIDGCIDIWLRTVPYTVYGRKAMVPDGHGIIRTPYRIVNFKALSASRELAAWLDGLRDKEENRSPKKRNLGQAWSGRQVRCAQYHKRTAEWTYTINLNWARGAPDLRESCARCPECGREFMRPCQTGVNSQTDFLTATEQPYTVPYEWLAGCFRLRHVFRITVTENRTIRLRRAALAHSRDHCHYTHHLGLNIGRNLSHQARVQINPDSCLKLWTWITVRPQCPVLLERDPLEPSNDYIQRQSVLPPRGEIRAHAGDDYEALPVNNAGTALHVGLLGFESEEELASPVHGA